MKNYWELRMAFRNYCCENRLCTMACNEQYEKMIKMFAELETIETLDNLSAMLWICSDTNKSIKDIWNDLYNIYLA